jgi:hypothetical protein
MVQGDLFEPPKSTKIPEPTANEIMESDPEYLYEKYRKFYDYKHKEYERELAAMGVMKQENRTIPADILALVKDALRLQRYITAKAEANPHQYCLRKSWEGYTLFTEVAQIIRDCGYVEWFWKKPYMMLNVGDFKYWTMGWPLDVTVLINRTLINPCTRTDLFRL